MTKVMQPLMKQNTIATTVPHSKVVKPTTANSTAMQMSRLMMSACALVDILVSVVEALDREGTSSILLIQSRDPFISTQLYLT